MKIYPEWRKIRAVPTPVGAGGLVIHNGMVAHGAGANMTPGRRRAMTIAYFPDGEVYNGRRDTLPDKYYDALQIGERLDDDQYVPLLWSRQKTAATALQNEQTRPHCQSKIVTVQVARLSNRMNIPANRQCQSKIASGQPARLCKSFIFFAPSRRFGDAMQSA